MHPLSSASKHHPWGLQRLSEEAFTTKVLPGFGLGLLMAAAGAYLGQGLPPAVLLGALLGEFLLVLTSAWWIRRPGLQTPMYFIVTLLSGMATVPLLAWAQVRGGPEIVTQALLTSTVAFMALGFVGFTTRRSLAHWGGALFAGALGLIVAGLLAAFVFPHSGPIQVGISGLSALLFGAFTIYDFQQIRTQYGDEDWLVASLALFLDFMGLFTAILRLLGLMGGRED